MLSSDLLFLQKKTQKILQERKSFFIGLKFNRWIEKFFFFFLVYVSVCKVLHKLSSFFSVDANVRIYHNQISFSHAISCFSLLSYSVALVFYCLEIYRVLNTYQYVLYVYIKIVCQLS